MKLLSEIRNCKVCRVHLPNPPRPIVRFSGTSRIVIVGQAPGAKVHASGVPWQDASGERLRLWLGVSDDEFYNPKLFGIVPMGFCYPGKGKSGDLPPRPECSALWMERVLARLKKRELILLVGGYSQDYFLDTDTSLTETVKNWKKYLPDYFVLPHPSPRNNIWMKKNSWFEKKTLPDLRRRVRRILK